MNFLATRSAPIARRLFTAAAVVAAIGSVTPAQAQLQDMFKPGSIYAASSLGLMYSGQDCDGTLVCEKQRIGGKVFGGYRFTPNLAAEVGFYYLGKFNATQGSNFINPSLGTRTAVNSDDHAVSLGIDWSNEMFGILRQHIRFGVARVTTRGTQSFGAGPEEFSEHKVVPFLGLGLSYQVTEYIRLYSSYDTMRNKRNENFHMFSFGVGVER